MEEPTKYFLYVFRKSDFYVLHYSKFDHAHQKYAIFEASLLYDYVDFANIEIVQYFDDFAFFDIDPNVKSFMSMYGIENVRGGTYREKELPEYKKKSLEEEIKTTKYICDKHSIVETIITEHITDLAYLDDNKDKIQTLYKTTCETIEKYEQLKKLYDQTRTIEYITRFNDIKAQYTLTRDFVSNIQFLEKIYNDGCKLIWISSEEYILYHKTFCIIKYLYPVFVDVYKRYYNNDFEIDEEKMIYVKNPEILLSKNTDPDIFSKVIELYIFMVHFMINRNEEYEFDMNTCCDNNPEKLYLQKAFYEKMITQVP